MVPDPETVATEVQTAIKMWSVQRERTVQSEDKVLGASDVGFCRNYAALLLKGAEFTDSPSTWAADVGTWVHSGVDLALASVMDHTEWLMGEHHGITTTTRIGDFEIPGHPDLLWMSANTCFDVKTKAGLHFVRTHGTTTNHRYQRALYALGAQQAGLLQDGPLYAGNIYLDRSGKDDRPYVDLEEVTEPLLNEIHDWLTDVTYAVQHGEDAMKDISTMVCERICAFYTACRGTEDWRGSGLIVDPDTILAVEDYAEVSAQMGLLRKRQDELKGLLEDVSGSTPTHTVRWTNVPESPTRAGYLRLDVRPVRG